MLVIHKLVAKRIAASIAIGLYTVAMIQNSWADFTLNTTSVKTGTAASPYAINDNNLIHIQGNGYLRVINGDGSNGGHVQLNAPNGLIIIDNGGTVDASAQSLGGNGGSVQINGGTVVNNGRIWANGGGTGAAGLVNIQAGTFTQGQTGNISAYGGSQAQGLGGAIRVSASDTITVDGKMRTSGQTGTNPTYNGAANQISLIGNGVTIASSANLGALGGGSLTISSRNGITQNGTISVEGSGTASGGFLTMNATSGNIDLNGLTTARGYQSSNGGHIVALANRGTVSVGSTGRLDANGGTNTSSSSVGRAGSVTLQGHHVSLTGNGTDVNVTANGGQSTLTGQAGQAGTITLQATAGDVTMTNAKLVASGRHGGNIDIEATGQIRLQGNGYVAANAANGQVGNGGTITLDASDIAITAHGAYETLVAEGTQNPLNAAGQGNGGSISLTASRTIDIDSTADNAGVKTAVMSVRGSNSDQAGNGGRIYLKAGTTLSFDEHQADAQFKRLLANANGGQAHQGNNGGGGLIQMSAGSMALNRAKLDASAGFNQTGTIADLAGDAGTVALRTADALALVNTTVTANASGSAGGGGQLLLESTHGDIVLTNTFAGLLSNAQSHLDVATGGNITQFGGELYARGVGIAGHGGNVTLAFGNSATANLYRVDANSYYTALTQNLPTTGNGGHVAITGGNLNLSSANSWIKALGGSTSGNGGSIDLNLAGDLYTANKTQVDASGLAGSGKSLVTMMAKSMALNGSVEASGRASNQNGGIINLASTGGAMVIAPTAVINAGGDRFDDNLTPGNGGSITMTTKNGNMDIQGAVLANGSVGKNGGKISVNVDGNLTLQGNGRLHATSKLGNNSGNGGTVAIKANNITINAVNSNVSSIDVSSFNGNGGTVTLAAQQGITVNSSQTTLNKATIEASSFYGGKGGTVLIENNSLLHDIRFTKNGNDALVSANGGDLLSFFSAGSGGEMTLTSKRHIIFTNNSSDTTPTYLTAHGGRGVFGGGQGGSIKLHSAGQTTAQNSGSSNYDVKGGQGLLWGSGEDGTVEHE